jgi:hypothetical protein
MFDPKKVENEVYALVTLAPLKKEEILALLAAVKTRVETLPTFKVS